MSSENEEVVRQTYQHAKGKDIEAFVGNFTDDGTFRTSPSVSHTGQAAGRPRVR